MRRGCGAGLSEARLKLMVRVSGCAIDVPLKTSLPETSWPVVLVWRYILSPTVQ